MTLRSYSLDEIFYIENGHAFKSGEFIDDGIPVIKIKNIKAGHFKEDEFSYVDPKFLNLKPNKVTRPDDILISMSGNRHDGNADTWVGKVCRFNKDEQMFINQRVGALRFRSPNLASANYMGYLLSQMFYQEYFISIATSSGGQANLSPGQILSVEVELPTLGKQQTIAAILGSLDNKIDLNRRTNETLEAMARALFRDWFVDFGPTRAKMAGQAPYLAPEIWDLFPDRLDDKGKPEGWLHKSISSLGEVVCGKTPSTKNPLFYGTEVPFITIPDMHNKVFTYNTRRYLSALGARSQQKKTLPPFSICVSCIATPGLVTLTKLPSQTNQQINAIIPHDKNNTFFIYETMRNLSQEIHSQGSGGSVFFNLSTGKFKEISILLPKQGVLDSFHNSVYSIFEKILYNGQQSHNLSQLRDLLLPKLMSGEICIRDAEKMVADAL